MTEYLKQNAIMVTLLIIGAPAIIVTAIVFKGTEYENAWFYVFAVWIVLVPLVELYLKKKNKTK